MMDDIFQDMVGVIVIYIDDLLIYTRNKSRAEHLAICQEVLKRL